MYNDKNGHEIEEEKKENFFGFCLVIIQQIRRQQLQRQMHADYEQNDRRNANAMQCARES